MAEIQGTPVGHFQHMDSSFPCLDASPCAESRSLLFPRQELQACICLPSRPVCARANTTRRCGPPGCLRGEAEREGR